MFKADIFSVHKPLFNKVTDLVQEDVACLLIEHYSKCGTMVGTVYQSGAIELNSNNFLIELGSRKYVLKRGLLGSIESQKTINLQATLVNILASNDIRVTEIIENNNGHLITTDSKYFWCLMAFVEGTYFSGVGDELENAGVEMLNLFTTLIRLDQNSEYIKTVHPLVNSDRQLLNDLENASDDLPNIFGDYHASLISKHWGLIGSVFQEVLDSHDNIINNMKLVHYDLHPHNILMCDEQVAAILDFDSLVNAPLGVTFSFNFFKLLRQAVVFRNGEFSQLNLLKQKNKVIKMAIARGLIKSNDNLALLAKVEILRRTLLILKLNFIDGNSNWNHVLPIHLNALKEVDMVYL